MRPDSDFDVFFGVCSVDPVDLDGGGGGGHTGIDGLEAWGVVSLIGELTDLTVGAMGGVFSVNSDADIEFLQNFVVGSC